MIHIVLLGDSVFDNAPYVEVGQEVVEALRRRLPPDWRVTLLARDGAVLGGIDEQLLGVPPDATHLFVSAGGNDALGWSGRFADDASSVGQALLMLAGLRREFERRYRTMLEAVLRLRRPTTLCTIYDVRFPDAAFNEVAVTALTLLNDVITREAAARDLPVLDLRLLLDEEIHFANPIEPSAQGGERLARAILRVTKNHDFRRPCSTIYATM